MEFKKAKRTQVKLKLGISGPSGGGKTYSALELASGIGNKVAVIDTENGSASLYSDRFDFDVLEITPPYTVEKYIQAIDASVSAGYDVVVVDSISPAWSGEGGLLEKKNQIDARGGNSFTNWSKITPLYEKFIGKILHSNIHTIATMRSKQDYVIQENSRGKNVPQKLGLSPIMREGFEYELTILFDVAMNHEASVSKDRTGLFVDKYFQINKETGQMIMSWLDSGAPNPLDEKLKALTNTAHLLNDKLDLGDDTHEVVKQTINKSAKDQKLLEDIIKRLETKLQQQGEQNVVTQ